MDNIVKVSRYFDFCFVVNDNHSENDLEFNYLPKHMITGSQDVARLYHYDKQLESKNILFLKKNTLSAVHSEYNKNIILSNKFDKIVVGGFCGCLDVKATCLSLIDEKQNIFIMPDCIDDITEEHWSDTLKYLSFIGIKTIQQDEIKLGKTTR